MQFSNPANARRRAMRRRVAARRAARPAELNALTGGQLPSLASAGPRRTTRAEFVAYLAAVVVATGAACAAVAVGLPVFGHGWEPVRLAAGVAATAVAAWGASWAGRRLTRRTHLVAVAAATSVLLLFSWGAATQVVIDGKPYAATSDTARAWKLTSELYRDLNRMAELDVLLAYDLPDVRANLRRYEPAEQELAFLAAKWANVRIDDLPDGRFAPILRHVATAGDFGAQAMSRKRGLALQYDARAEAEMNSFRATFITEVLTAGPLLAELSDLYGFGLRQVEGGLVE
jgi:hypothetical protein